MRLERARDGGKSLREIAKDFLKDESGKGQPPSTEAGKKLLHAAVLGGGIVAGLNHFGPENENVVPLPTEQSTTNEEQEERDIDLILKQMETHVFPSVTFTAEDLKCLVDNVYYETRGEPIKGKAAAVFVVLERMITKGYPNTVCGVVYQPLQFSWTADKDLLAKPIDQHDYLKTSLEVYSLVQGKDFAAAKSEAQLLSGLPKGAIYYKMKDFKGSKAVQKFFQSLEYVGRINNHDFYIDSKDKPKAAGSSAKSAHSPKKIEATGTVSEMPPMPEPSPRRQHQQVERKYGT